MVRKFPEFSRFSLTFFKNVPFSRFSLSRTNPVGGVSLFHSNLALSDACKLKIDNYPEFYKSIVDL